MPLSAGSWSSYSRPERRPRSSRRPLGGLGWSAKGSIGDRPNITSSHDEAFWRDFLTNGGAIEHYGRLIFRRIPSDPRCKICAAPFAGPGAPVMRLIGRPRSPANPRMCNACFLYMTKHRGGAEVEGTMLFADIRGSTTIAESMSPRDFHALLQRFYAAASDAVFGEDGTVDKFVGDELVAMFFPLLSGARHAERALKAARRLLELTGHAQPDGPWIPVGAGVHTGLIWFGVVGEGTHMELTAVGDRVNVTARLASRAEAGEILVTEEAALSAGLDPGLERVPMALKGKTRVTRVVRLRVEPRGDR